jgi:hypothetical protein
MNGWNEVTCMGPRQALCMVDMRSERSQQRIVDKESLKM